MGIILIIILVFETLFGVYLYIFRKKLINIYNQISLDNEVLRTKYYRLIELQEEHRKEIDIFDSQAMNKMHELSLVLLHIKQHYEITLSNTDEYLEPEMVEELKLSIENVDDQLKEIGFINNKKRTSSSLIKNLYTISNSNFSKN